MVGPVDLQNVVSKAASVQKAQHQQQHQPIADIQEFAQEEAEKSSLKEKQVQETPSSGQAKLEEKEHGDAQEEKRKKASSEKDDAAGENEAEEAVSIDPERGHNIDIKA